MGESYMQPASIIRDAIRLLFATLDHAFYSILQAVYELFFNVASAEIISDSTVMTFFGRIQLILGVFMMFQLAMTILKGIVNPDSFMDAKTGAGNLITRIITALVLLTMLVPLNIPANNEYEEQVRSNGILFGTLYSLQHRLLANNTLGILIFGNNSVDYVSSNSDTSELRKSSRVFTATVMKSFYRINLLPESQRTQHQEGKDDAIFNANRVCKNIDNDLLTAYTREDADPDDITGMVNETCLVNVQGHILPRKMYAFTYMPLLSLIVAIVFIFILISFSVDVAVRAIKLAVLRLIAPIPIIGYMDPKGSKDSSFNAWTKAVTSTYLDLFIRLASVYFVIFLISDIIRNGLVVNHHGGVLGFFTTILIFIGLFVFAKQAPKFIKEVLGLKGDTGNIFSGLGTIVGAGAAVSGVVSGGISNAVANHKPGDTSFKNVGKTVLAGLTGAVGGGYAAGRAFWKSKDGSSGDVMKAVRAHNAKNYSNAADDSTFWGRRKTEFASALGLKNNLQKMDDKIAYYGAAESAMKRITNAFDGNGDYKVKYTGDDLVDSYGNKIIEKGKKYSLKDFKDIYSRVQASGDNRVISAVDSVMKNAQGKRLDELRSIGREELVRRVNSTDEAWKEWTNNDLIAYDSAKTIYDVAQKYKDEPIFARFKDADGKQYKFEDAELEWGSVFKHEAGQAGKAADQIKNSGEYSRAKADAQRVTDSQKK